MGSPASPMLACWGGTPPTASAFIACERAIPPHIGPQVGLDFRGNASAPFFSGEDTVDQRGRVGMCHTARHGSPFGRPYGTCSSSGTLPRTAVRQHHWYNWFFVDCRPGLFSELPTGGVMR